MIHCEPHQEGAVLAVRASPGAKRDEIRGEHDGALKVAVTQAPEEGKANQAIIELLAKRMRLEPERIQVHRAPTGVVVRFQ